MRPSLSAIQWLWQSGLRALQSCRRWSSHAVGLFAGAACALLIAAPTPVVASPTCFGQFPNPITDICWSCIFPLSIGDMTILEFDQEDISNPSDPLCFCATPTPRIGIEIGFWEPARLIEVTRTPYCLVSLGGIDFDPGIDAPRGAQDSRAAWDGTMRGSTYQVHYYTNLILYYLEVLLDFPCLEKGSLDLAYLTELDPAWNDDQLTAILNPEAILFANPVAQAACAADCVAASIGFGIKEMIWCAGCNGTVYPLDGHVQAHVGGVQASSLLVQRMLAKMHRQMLAWRWHGRDAQCGPKLAPLMDKIGYKTQLVYPVPNTSKDEGRCCQPLGRTTQIWGMAKEYPIKGEDFSYMVFRKRNCCAW